MRSMAGTKFSKDSVEFKMFTEFWKILQDYYIPENSDEYWESFIKVQNEFIQKYDHELCRELSKLLVNYLEAKMKREVKDNG